MQTVTTISSFIVAMALTVGAQTCWINRGLDALGGRIDRLESRKESPRRSGGRRYGVPGAAFSRWEARPGCGASALSGESPGV